MTHAVTARVPSSCWLGARLAACGSSKLSAVARGATLRALQGDGLQLADDAVPLGSVVGMPVRAIANAAHLDLQDLFIVAVLAPAHALVATGIAPLLGPTHHRDDRHEQRARREVPRRLALGQPQTRHLQDLDISATALSAVCSEPPAMLVFINRNASLLRTVFSLNLLYEGGPT